MIEKIFTHVTSGREGRGGVVTYTLKNVPVLVESLLGQMTLLEFDTETKVHEHDGL